VPNIRALAESDLGKIIEDVNGAGTPYTLIDSEGEYPVIGTFGDIAFLIDPVSGEAIQGRTISAACRASTIIAAAGKVPARGWKVRTTGLDGKVYALYVQRNEYDRSIGLCRLTLGLKLKELSGKETEND
jgi:hypothetical protein